jgi:signal transduction histidine kinase
MLIPLLYLASYVALDAMSFVHPLSPLGITPWNPPPGLSLALLLVFGLRNAPWLPVAFLVAEAIVRGAPGSVVEIGVTGLIVTAGYVAAAAWLDRRGFDRGFGSARDGLLFAGTAAAASFVVAVGYVAVYAFSGRIGPLDVATNVLHYWVGDLNGLLVLTPALLLLRKADVRHTWRTLGRRDLAEIVAQVLAIAVVLWVIFGVRFADDYNLFYLLFLPLTWIALRWGLPGATAALAATQLGLVGGIQWIGYHAATFVEFQLFMLAVAFTALLLGATVSEQRRSRAALLQKQQELAHARQFVAAGELTSVLAHELNNPLAALTTYLGAAEILAGADPAPQAAELRATLHKAEAEAHRAALVVQRLRTFFRTGQLMRQPVSPRELVEEVAARLEPEAARLGVALRVESSDATPVDLDRVQMATVLQNLATNGLEAASSGTRSLREVRMGARIAASAVEFVVDDSGPGLDADRARQLFEPFRTTKARGLGLGLAICRTLVEAHGGRITAGASPSGGARFSVTIPLA